MALNFSVQATAVASSGIEQLQDKLLGLPLKGTRVGGGIHVPMPDSWNGSGAVPPGWTSYLGSTRKHPTNSQWATPIDPAAAAALSDARASRLTAGERTTLQSAVTGATALSVDWGVQ